MTAIQEQIKAAALFRLQERRGDPPARIDNAALPAGSPMHFYCSECGAISDILREDFLCKPRTLCSECQMIKENGWMT